MKHYFEQTEKKNLKLNLINKFIYATSKNLPKLDKITVYSKKPNVDYKFLVSAALALKIITNQKCTFILSKKPNAFLKLRKGQPVGAKLTLRRKNKNNFATKILFDIFLDSKNVTNFNNLNCSSNSLTLLNSNIFVFKELENHFNTFQKVQSFHIMYTTNSVTKKENCFVLKFYKVPVNLF